MSRPGFVSALSIALLLAGCAATKAPPARPPIAFADELTAYIERALAELDGVPGLAVAVYTPEGVYARGFGVVDIETNQPVDADTAFYVASSTKSFTALALAILHERGEIDLDASIAELAPDAPFPAEIRADAVTPRHLLSHTSGIDNPPIAMRYAYSGQYTADEMWDLIRHSTVNPSAPLGQFDYTNVGYNLLTLLTDRKLGKPWQDLVADELYGPAGLTRTTSRMSEAERRGWSVARPHRSAVPGGTRRLYLEKTDTTMQSAGGALMSANDALRWLELMLHDGVIDGEQVVPAEAVTAALRPEAELERNFGPYTRRQYGLGWYLGGYGDQRMVHHFGSFAGFRAHVSFLPEHGIGVAAFVNDSGGGFPLVDEVANHAYDRYLGVEDLDDRVRASLERLAEFRQRSLDRVTLDRERRAGREWRLTRPLEAYAGIYVSELMGTVDVAVRDDNLFVRIGNLRSASEPFVDEDSIRLELVPYSGDVVRFAVSADGAVDRLNLGGLEYVRR